MASIFDAKASFKVGDITVTLAVDPSKVGVRPEHYPAVRKWLKEVAATMEKHMTVDSDGIRFIKPKAKTDVRRD